MIFKTANQVASYGNSTINCSTSDMFFNRTLNLATIVNYNRGFLLLIRYWAPMATVPTA